VCKRETIKFNSPLEHKQTNQILTSTVWKTDNISLLRTIQFTAIKSCWE